MNIFTGVLVYIVVWWIALFTVLPFGHVRDEDGTPRDPHIKKKFIWTSILSAVIWIGIFSAIEMDIISFRDIAKDMMEQDYQ